MSGAFGRNRKATFTGTSQQTAAITLKRGGVITLSGTWVATVALQRYDINTSAWEAVTSNSGTAVTFTANGTYTVDPNQIAGDYRVACTAWTSGSVGVIFEGR